MLFLHKIAPKKFLCKYPLRTGAFFVGILMCVVMVICITYMAIQLVLLNKCKKCDEYTFKSAYGFSSTGVVNYIFMLLLNLWYLWGLKKTKSSVVIAYLVVSVIWLAQTLSQVIVMICLYIVDHNSLVWKLCLFFGLAAIAILGYCLLVVFGYWLELKNPPTPNDST